MLRSSLELKKNYFQILLAVLFLGSLVYPYNLLADDTSEFFFVYFGSVISVDTNKQSMKLVGSFSRAAPTVKEDLNGFLWGKIEPNYLAALDPATGKIAARVPLRYKVYNHIIAPNGKAYVTHNTVTEEGFTISVVDTDKKKLVHEIRNISGLRTDITQQDGIIYLATVGVSGEDYLHLRLYLIDSRNDRLEEIYHYPEKGYYWRINVNEHLLYIGFYPTSNSELRSKIEIMELESHKIVRTIDSSFWGEGKNLKQIYIGHDRTFLLLQTDNGDRELIMADSALTRIQRILPVNVSINHIFCIHGDLLLYFDNPLETQGRRMSLYFYDMKRMREIKRINIPQFLALGKK